MTKVQIPSAMFYGKKAEEGSLVTASCSVRGFLNIDIYLYIDILVQER